MSASNNAGGRVWSSPAADAADVDATSCSGWSAKVISTTRRVMRLSETTRTLGVATLMGSIPRAPAGAISGPSARRARPGVRADEVDDRLHGGARDEHTGNPERVQFREILVGNDPANHHLHVVEPLR